MLGNAFSDARDEVEPCLLLVSYSPLAPDGARTQRLAAIFLQKFPALPSEMLERVVEFTWDIGGH